MLLPRREGKGREGKWRKEKPPIYIAIHSSRALNSVEMKWKYKFTQQTLKITSKHKACTDSQDKSNYLFNKEMKLKPTVPTNHETQTQTKVSYR